MPTITDGTPVMTTPFFHAPSGKQGCRAERHHSQVKGRAYNENGAVLVVFDTYRLPACNCERLPRDRAAFLPQEVTPA